ncbi:unnamed protein product, partial [Leptidea sinapis]
MMADKEQVIQALRATLISVKGAITLKQCNRDYRELEGEWIPYRKLGFTSLEKLFHEVPGFDIREVNGEWYVDAIPSQETKHIAMMVACQKPNKKSGAKLGHSSRFPKKQGSWRKPFPPRVSHYKSDYSNTYQHHIIPSFNNNDYAKKPSRYYVNVKTNETKNSFTKTNDSSEKEGLNTIKNYQTNTQLQVSAVEEYKHSTKNVKETEIKGSGKMSASQRLSKLRDRLNPVDCIPLQMPAHSEQVKTEDKDAVSHVVSACNVEPPPDLTSPIAILEWTCKKLCLPQPVYKVSDLKTKGVPVTYHCKVTVGDTYSASSYPDSSPSKEGAMEVASVKLLKEMESLNRGGLLTSSNAKALAGLVEIVSEHEAGIWATSVPNLYRAKYNENLPSNWLELVENSPKIIKDRLVNDYVLLPSNKEVPSFADDLTDEDLPPLQFPDDDFWNVFITVANSTLEVWVRIIGPEYSDSFELLLAEMSRYYEHYGTAVDEALISQNAWYAVKLEEGGWQRAKVLEIEKNTATVFLGDHGDDDTVDLSEIKVLERQFRQLPAQAVLCRLEGAEELAASAAGSSLARTRLVGEVLVAAPGPRADPTDPAVPLVLYDTSTHRDLDLNKEIVHDFCMAGAFAITQNWCEVEVACV